MKRVMMLMAVVLMAGSAWAADIKVGYIDMQRALNMSEAGKIGRAHV